MAEKSNTSIRDTSRRHFLAGAPAAALVLSAGAANAVTGSDARLIELGRLWDDLNAQIVALDKLIEPLGERYNALAPPWPEGTRAGFSVLTAAWPEELLKSVFEENGRLYYSDRGIEFLRTWEPKRTTWAHPKSDTDWTEIEIPDVKAKQHAERAVSAYDKWRADLDELGNRLGYSQLCDEQERLYNRVAETREEIAATPATSPKGLAVKARLLQDFWAEAEPNDAGERMALSIARDLTAAA